MGGYKKYKAAKLRKESASLKIQSEAANICCIVCVHMDASAWCNKTKLLTVQDSISNIMKSAKRGKTTSNLPISSNASHDSINRLR